MMKSNIKSFDTAFNEKLKQMEKEKRAKAGLKKLSQEMIANKCIKQEPEGLASGASDANGKMIIDLEEDYDDDQ